MKPATSLKARALRHLARREHSRAELARKLLAHLSRSHAVADPSEARQQVDHTLDELAAGGLLSDVRAAESLLASRAARFGTRRLKQALQARGLPPDLVAPALEAARTSESQRAHDLWRRRFGGSPATDATERARQARFLAGRGFDAEVIGRVVRGLEDPEA